MSGRREAGNVRIRVGGRAEPEDLIVLGGEPGQGLSSEVGEFLDRLIGLGQAGSELVGLCFQPFDLHRSRIGLLPGVLQLPQPVLELGA